MAFRKKYHKLLDSNPDIIVIQESENKEKLVQFLDGVDYKQILWFGDNPHKGVAIIGFNNYQIQLHDKYNPEYKYVIPLTIQADKELIHLFAIWAMPHPTDKSKSYVGQVWNAIHYYNQELKTKSILIGDFNSHVRWDTQRHPGNHSGVVAFLKDLNIHSCYHHFYQIEQGQELDSTWYMYKHADKSYHLDYCFASACLIKDMTIEIGRFDDWIALSDHLPLFINFS